ncbi:MAG: thiamine diphosphokinase [Anaerolineae bacterium]|nr:thiamine diphosphokinase [Anaerolineae bacterium]
MNNSAVVFANGDLLNVASLAARIQPDDLLVAVDGGLRHIAGMGRIPDVLIGDLDSVAPEDVAGSRLAGCEVIRFPPQKDKTDLELAVDLVLERGFTNLVIVGATGGRLDHTLGNLYLLMRPDLVSLDVRLDDGVQEVMLVRSSLCIQGQPGDIVSLIPLTARVEGVCTRGLQYPLDDEILYQYATRGISNVMMTSDADLRIGSGLLLGVHTRQPEKGEDKND